MRRHRQILLLQLIRARSRLSLPKTHPVKIGFATEVTVPTISPNYASPFFSENSPVDRLYSSILSFGHHNRQSSGQWPPAKCRHYNPNRLANGQWRSLEIGSRGIPDKGRGSRRAIHSGHVRLWTLSPAHFFNVAAVGSLQQPDVVAPSLIPAPLVSRSH
jgi:hypothetical protein